MPDTNLIIHEEKHFENITYEDKHIEARIFRKCTFHKASLKSCHFEDTVFESCVFDDCDLSLMKLKSTSFSNVTLKNCKALGVLWTDADNPFSIQFIDTRLSFSSFYGKMMKKARFLNCQANEIDFTKCNLSSADFAGTDLRDAQFDNTDLSGASFVGATNYRIDPKANKIAKAKFSLPEALSFLYQMNIELVEEGT